MNENYEHDDNGRIKLTYWRESRYGRPIYRTIPRINIYPAEVTEVIGPMGDLWYSVVGGERLHERDVVIVP